LTRSSPLTTSTGCNTSTPLTDKESVLEEPEDEDEDEEEEGRTGRREGGAEEEEVSRDKENISNLMKSRNTETQYEDERTLGSQSKY